LFETQCVTCGSGGDVCALVRSDGGGEIICWNGIWRLLGTSATRGRLKACSQLMLCWRCVHSSSCFHSLILYLHITTPYHTMLLFCIQFCIHSC